MIIEFFVPGIPRPGGSKKSFNHPKTGKIITMDSCKGNKDWRNTVSYYARWAYTGDPVTLPILLNLAFYLPRPKSHYGTGKNAGKLKGKAPLVHTIKPDATKLVRSTEDALTGIIWKDDAQIIIQNVYKIYGEKPGCKVRIMFNTEDYNFTNLYAQAIEGKKQ